MPSLCRALLTTSRVLSNSLRVSLSSRTENSAPSSGPPSQLYSGGLYLSNNNISNAGAVALAQALHHNSTLERLNLSNTNISDAGAVALAQALHYNSTLKRLDLSKNDAKECSFLMTSRAACLIAKFLQS